MATNAHESNSYRIVTKHCNKLDGGILGPLSESPAVLGPLVTIGGPVTVGGSLRRNEVELLCNGLAVLGVSLADGGTPGGPRISGGARSGENRKGGEGDAIVRLGNRNGGCLGKTVVVILPLVAVLRPGLSCSPRGTVSHYDRKELTTEIRGSLTESGLSGDDGKVWGIGGGLVLLSQLHAPVFPRLVLAPWVVEENSGGRHDDDK